MYWPLPAGTTVLVVIGGGDWTTTVVGIGGGAGRRVSTVLPLGAYTQYRLVPVSYSL